MKDFIIQEFLESLNYNQLKILETILKEEDIDINYLLFKISNILNEIN